MNKPIDISGVCLKTERLVLRPWREADLDDLYEYARVDGVGQMAGWASHKNIEESKKILDSFIRHKKTFAIVLDGKIIGSVGVEEYNAKDFPELASLQGREIGYVLSKDHWGKGLMPEAVKGVIRYLFTQEELDFVTAGHFTWNHQSARVIEKCGFRYMKDTQFRTQMGTEECCRAYVLFNR